MITRHTRRAPSDATIDGACCLLESEAAKSYITGGLLVKTITPRTPHRSFVDICILVIMTLKSGCPPSENFGNQCVTTTDGGLLDVDQAGSVQLLSPEQVLPDDLTAIKEYAAQKKLCAEQVVEVEAFIKNSSADREAKLFVMLLALRNELNKNISVTPAYEISPDLRTKIKNYAIAVLLSDKLESYKGQDAKHSVLALLNKYTNHDVPTEYAQLDMAVCKVFNMKRVQIKTAISRSLKSPCQSILCLAQVIIRGTQCTVNAALCARIALLRQVYVDNPGFGFWIKVDKHLAAIRDESGGSPHEWAWAFNRILQDDMKKYSLDDDLAIEEAPVDDSFQQDVDNMIEAVALNATTSVGATPRADVEDQTINDISSLHVD
ncbi:hypothetical protein B0H16DRAFT_199742 [Mycena metata]|uniref:Uncharacterized protein n=1 Tax=Mycena metata TaxID=1033252 RepID=A0AAD7HZM5_9AGAR|nr:hypothetical protein B0H16DRAFT_199742 [Mycena metata]